MLMLFICVKLLSVFICCNCLLSVFDLFLCLLTIAISFYVFVITQWFVLSVLNIIHVLDLLIPNIYRIIILHNVLLLTCSISYLLFLFVVLWNVNKISISKGLQRIRVMNLSLLISVLVNWMNVGIFYKFWYTQGTNEKISIQVLSAIWFYCNGMKYNVMYTLTGIPTPPFW
jgi:hypothetical protein